MLLIDAGCEYAGYASDITVTWPASGRFTEAQAKVYEAVLRVQQDVVAAVRPGATFKQLNTIACEGLWCEMQALGLVDAERSIDELMEAQAYKPYYMHSIGHWIGMDVHDVGSYGKDRSRPFEPGMVLTVEPGIYIAPDAPDALAELRGIAVRIEDDIAVTTGEPRNLTHGLPRTVQEIHEFMDATRAERTLRTQLHGREGRCLPSGEVLKPTAGRLDDLTKAAGQDRKDSIEHLHAIRHEVHEVLSIDHQQIDAVAARAVVAEAGRFTIQEAHLTKALKGTKPEQIVPISVKLTSPETITNSAVDGSCSR